jgi:hypothetical protein
VIIFTAMKPMVVYTKVVSIVTSIAMTAIEENKLAIA